MKSWFMRNKVLILHVISVLTFFAMAIAFGYTLSHHPLFSEIHAQALADNRMSYEMLYGLGVGLVLLCVCCAGVHFVRFIVGSFDRFKRD